MRRKRFLLAALIMCGVVVMSVYIYFNTPDRLALMIYGYILGIVSMGAVLFIVDR